VLYSASAALNEVWAAGSANRDGRDVPFIARWAGDEWREIPAPAVGRISDTLWGIDVDGADGWAVGSTIQDAQGNNAPVTLRLVDPCTE
jgi:hypothetical protein